MASVYADAALVLTTLLVTPYLISRLGAEPYGVLALVSVLAGQLTVLQLGIGPATTRLVAEHRGRGELREIGAILRAALLWSLASGACIGLAFAALAPWAWTNFFKATDDGLRIALSSIAPALVVVALQPALAALTGFLIGEERFGLVAAWRLTFGVSRMAAAAGVAAAGGGVPLVISAQAATDVVALIAVLVASTAAHAYQIPVRSIAKSLRTLFALGAPFALVGVLATVLVDAEKLAVSAADSVREFTFYFVPYVAVSRLSLVSGGLATALMPRVASLAAARGGVAAARLTARATRLSIGGMMAILAPLVALTPELLAFWLGPDFADKSTRPTRILLVALLANTSAYAASAALRAKARPVTLAILYAVEIPVHLIIVYVAVSNWGIVGAATAWALRAILDAAAQRALAARTFGATVGRPADTWLMVGALALFAGATELFGADAQPLTRAAFATAIAGGSLWWLYSREDWESLRRAVLPWRRSSTPDQPHRDSD